MKFNILYSSRAKKFLEKAEKNIARRLVDKIEGLSNAPLTPETRKIIGSEDLFRLRAGKYRILYKICFDEETIIIVRIDKRERIYGRRFD